MLRKVINILVSVIMLLNVRLVIAQEKSASSAGDQKETPVFELSEIVVTATRYPVLLKDTPASVSVITTKDIEKIEAKKVGDILRKTVGLNITSYGSAGSLTQANLRGSLSSQVLVLVDGRPINSPSSGEANLSEIPVDNIERIEVMRGPASSLYGANAVGGVINVITKNSPDKMTTTLNSSYGSFNTLTYKIENGATFGDFGYFLTGGKTKSDGSRQNSDYDGLDLTGKLEYGRDTKLTLAGAYHQDELGTPGSQPAEDTKNRTSTQKKFGNDDVSSLFDRQKGKKGYIDTSLKIKLNDISELSPKLYFENNRTDYHQEYVSGTKTYQEDDIYKTNILGTDLQYDNLSVENNHLTFGFNYRQENFDAEQLIYDVSNKTSSASSWGPKATTKAIYGEDEIKVFEHLIVVPGIRWDNHSIYGNQVNPRLSALYKLNNVNLRASVGRAFRAPTLNDLYWPETASDKGNPDLKPETAWAYEIGVERWFSVFLARIGLFRKEIKNMIAWAPTGPMGSFGPKWQPSNINSLVNNGVELELKTQFTKELSLTLGYTYLDAKQKNSEIINSVTNEMNEVERLLADTPQNQFNLTSTYESSFGMIINFGGRYVDKRYRYYANYSNYPLVSMDTKELLSYFVTDIKVTQSILEYVKLFVSIDNIFDIKYKERLGSSMTDRDYPMPGRIFTGGISLVF